MLRAPQELIIALSLTSVRYASAFHFLSAAITLKPKHGQLFMLLASRCLTVFTWVSLETSKCCPHHNPALVLLMTLQLGLYNESIVGLYSGSMVCRGLQWSRRGLGFDDPQVLFILLNKRMYDTTLLLSQTTWTSFSLSVGRISCRIGAYGASGMFLFLTANR